MKGIKWWQFAFGAALVAASVFFYLLHYFIYRDPGHILSYIITDLAFLPLEVLIVTMIIHELLSIRETRERLEKLNMVIGVFFTEMGSGMLRDLVSSDPDMGGMVGELKLSMPESAHDFAGLIRRLEGHHYTVDMKKVDLEAMRSYLASKRDFILRLLENPALLEHESFTDMLLALSHLVEELMHREALTGLPEHDMAHLKGDIKRFYSGLAVQWTLYMKHLKENYPYLFSLALRTNPFDRDASVVVRS